MMFSIESIEVLRFLLGVSAYLLFIAYGVAVVITDFEYRRWSKPSKLAPCLLVILLAIPTVYYYYLRGIL